MHQLPVLARHPAAGYYMENPKRLRPNRSGPHHAEVRARRAQKQFSGDMSKLVPHFIETLKL